MRVGDNNRAAVSREDIVVAGIRRFQVKIICNKVLNTHIDGEIDIVTNGWEVQGLIYGIGQAGNADIAAQIVIEIFLNSCHTIGSFGAKSGTDIIANYRGHRRMRVEALVDTQVAGIRVIGIDGNGF